MTQDRPLEKFAEWLSPCEAEKLFWSITAKTNAENGWFAVRHGNRHHAKLRDEVLPTIQLCRELLAQPEYWDHSLSLRFNPNDKKTEDGYEYDVEFQFRDNQPELKLEKARNYFVEVTRSQISVRDEKETDRKLSEGQDLMPRISDSDQSLICYENLAQRIKAKVSGNYSKNTILCVYLDGDESRDGVNWLKEKPDQVETLRRLAFPKFSQLFLWGPSAGKLLLKPVT